MSEKKKKLNPEEWIKNAAIFYYQIFSSSYDELFLAELLKGGGGNSTLCGSWMKLSSKFVKYRISKTALNDLKIKGVQYSLNNDIVEISKKDIKKNKSMFSNDSKSTEKRELSGKFFHFDHNPSNKHILTLLNSKVKELSIVSLSQEEKIELLSDYISKIQTVDLITIKQDDMITKADRLNKNALSKDVRDKLLKDTWYNLVIK